MSRWGHAFDKAWRWVFPEHRLDDYDVANLHVHLNLADMERRVADDAMLPATTRRSVRAILRGDHAGRCLLVTVGGCLAGTVGDPVDDRQSRQS